MAGIRLRRERKTKLTPAELEKASRFKVIGLVSLYPRMDRLLDDAMNTWHDGLTPEEAADLIVHLQAATKLVRQARLQKVIDLTKTKYEFLKEER